MERIVCVDYGLKWEIASLRNRNETNRVIIHHTTGPDYQNASTIHAYHLSLGWSGIGYHYLINSSGVPELGRPRDAIGAHAECANYDSVGVAVIGDFSVYPPSRSQIENLSILIANICSDYDIEPSEETIIGHRDVDATSCPGTALYELIPDIIGKAIYYIEQND